MGRTLKDFPDMPYPSEIYLKSDINRMISEETSYDTSAMKDMHDTNFKKMNAEQRSAYDSIINRVYKKDGGVFFVHGSGGCGKTFLWQTIISRLRSEHKIVIPVASSGIAATLLPGGRTAHSRFHIPIKLDQHSTAGIKHGTDLAELLQHTDLIVWDEAPMQHRYAFECVDRSLRDIMSAVDSSNSAKPFGGITIVFGGDYRQILPVIPKAGRPDIVAASLNRSKLWDHAEVHLLSRNMRLHAGNTPEQNRIIKDFSEWQLRIGDGKKCHDFEPDASNDANMKMPERFLIHAEESPLQSLVDRIYPGFEENFQSHEYIRDRAILTPTNVVVDDINKIILDKIPGETYTYYSQDSMEDNGSENNDFAESFPIEYINSLNMPCIPKHELKLKVGTPVMLMRNLNQILGLCNGTRMIVTGCKKNSIECQIITGTHKGTKHLIPRIDMIPTDTIWPFDFKRTQFPLQICFAMTINKSQGQSLGTVGLYLPRPVFTHGQLYVAISRVTSPDGLHIMIVGDDGHTKDITKNVVYEEVFYNIPSVT
nr:PREDICTED: ATP-dependent DNA helicase PIF1-like [Daucus carota subsp. sativus]